MKSSNTVEVPRKKVKKRPIVDRGGNGQNGIGLLLKQMEISFEEQRKDTVEKDFGQIRRFIPALETDYATHNLHPYPAKFIPHYPAIFIKNISKPGDTVLDPMCGAGTTLIESCLMGRKALGIEIDPIGHLISEVAITPLSFKALSTYKKDLLQIVTRGIEDGNHLDFVIPEGKDFPNVKIWFRDDTFKELLYIRSCIFNQKKIQKRYKNFALLCLSAIVRLVSNADPRDIFPQRDLSEPIRKKQDTVRLFSNILEQNAIRVLDFSRKVSFKNRGHVVNGDAREMPYADESVDLIFTSPPYAYAIDYARVHQLSTLLIFMRNEELRQHRTKYIGTDRISVQNALNDFEGISFAKQPLLELHEKDRKLGLVLHQYLKDMSRVTSECFRTLKTGGTLVYVIGNSTVKGTPFSTEEILVQICKNAGFTFERFFDRPYFAYRMARKRNVHSNTIKSDIFLVFKK